MLSVKALCLNNISLLLNHKEKYMLGLLLLLSLFVVVVVVAVAVVVNLMLLLLLVVWHLIYES